MEEDDDDDDDDEEGVAPKLPLVSLIKRGSEMRTGTFALTLTLLACFGAAECGVCRPEFETMDVDEFLMKDIT